MSHYRALLNNVRGCYCGGSKYSVLSNATVLGQKLLCMGVNDPVTFSRRQRGENAEAMGLVRSFGEVMQQSFKVHHSKRSLI